jgi:hypothetical protein
MGAMKKRVNNDRMNKSTVITVRDLLKYNPNTVIYLPFKLLLGDHVVIDDSKPATSLIEAKEGNDICWIELS